MSEKLMNALDIDLVSSFRKKIFRKYFFFKYLS